ncbi:MAG: N-formylglutamate deformylase [Mesorhizobium sp.]|uniref:N-formylglutamate deformylase n=1 Tax=Mesorhizobium sp. TaxID=1871066 RepID=UPI000FE6BDF7|nr:N-formylglutamate deformylase [Mesorhizobium sp.]RWH79250.1 MAG: N-formylglutamate deformylase [Mesorhizobium sp.]RWH81778.1 MAG: N-formylglutamate deformylase [Mesorhizobium sp.]RWH88044.1 MAG: N-formylglutamate deformylase [Mesorhizobium sp.]RWI01632.1 MAG: N-formylglutamate deformylase [Mesorhizobium sp.]RWI02079.1 MAG: N-formylglutamate deformylase [Mesorhizobium sp.]
MTLPSWLTVTQGTAPLLVSIPHTGIDLAGLENRLMSRWLGRRDADWWIDKLYDFAEELGATVVHTAISRTVIDVNRDPSGASLYPGQATTGLCPTETFDGDPLYRAGEEPGPSEVDERREKYFVPYHAALQAEIDRLRALHQKIVVYDCHSIRSVLPRLFEGTLPVFNLGTNDGKSADPALQAMVDEILAGTGETYVVNGRFKGGWITRNFGRPQNNVHALQMELSNRGYMREPEGKGTPDNWPVPYDPAFAAPIRATLKRILESAIAWAGR